MEQCRIRTISVLLDCKKSFVGWHSYDLPLAVFAGIVKLAQQPMRNTMVRENLKEAIREGYFFDVFGFRNIFRYVYCNSATFC